MSSIETTVTRLTSAAPSAIAVLQLDGSMALEYLDRVWRPNQGGRELQIDAIRYGFTLQDGFEKGESIVVCRTGDHRVEIHCHGGRLASETILRSLVSLGAMERSATAIMNTTDKEQTIAEAREDLVHATTLRTTAILLDQMRGALQREFETIQSSIQFGDLAEACARLKKLEDRWEVGRHLIVPWKVVFAGPPNSGKSSLLNLLLGYTRAIVHEQAGTTRDLLAERSSFDGWPVELIDGAGIRVATDSIESIGVENTMLQIASADCTLLLIDKTTGWTQIHSDILDQCGGKVVLVTTKADLILPKPDEDCLPKIPPQLLSSIAAEVETSSLAGTGLKQLMDAVVASLVSQEIRPGEPVPFRERHRALIASMIANTGQIAHPQGSSGT